MERSRKPKDFPAVERFVRRAKKEGKRIVTTNGIFDILHIGHVQSLEAAKALGDVLIVGVNSDASTRALKGKDRPIVPARERLMLVASLEPVDATFVFNETDPRKWLARLKPQIHVKGGDRRMEEIVERKVVERGGGRVVLLPLRRGRSTTRLVEKIRK